MTADRVSVTVDAAPLISSLAVILAGWEREDAHLLRQELATSRRRASTAEQALTEIRYLIAGERRPEPTPEEWVSVGARVVIPTERGSVLDRPTGPEAEALNPDDDEGVDEEALREAAHDLIEGFAAPTTPAASQPPPSAPPVQPPPPTRRPPPPPAAPIQEPPSRAPIPAEAREGDIPDPGPTVALRRPVVLACSTVEEAESCRRWPRWEAHEGTLDPEIKRLVGLLQEIEAAEHAGDAGALRDIRSRKLLESRPGVAARCQAALGRLLVPPSPSPSPVAAPVVSEPVSAEQGAVEPVVVESPPAMEGIDLGACPV
jgi:hypothetical protein